MDVFEEYKVRKSSEFQRLVGVNKGAFIVLKDKFLKELYVYKSELWTRKLGNRSSMSPENQILIYLLYVRNYETYLTLGKRFGISESYAYKRCKFTEMILLRCLNCPDIGSLKTNLETNLVAIDVCEQEIERPLKNQEDYYSGKKSDIR